MTRARIPAQGVNRDDVLTEMDGFRDGDVRWREGRTWSMMYFVSDEHTDFLKRASASYLSENGINPLAFRSLKRMESEVVQMTASMLHGPDSCVGTMTSGGTESILLALKAYRDRARKKWPWVRHPEVVVPNTIHVAFDKAAHLFGLRLRKARVLDNGQVDVAHFRKLIGRNTIALAASAPQYVTGTIDPIPELAALALKRGLPFHVDACFGGFILPWVEKLGHSLPLWDFRNEGVTSMSADAHKYGYAAKGASVVLYRDMSFLKHQFFVTTNWPGGIYASPSMPGSRPGAPIAAAWATLRAIGEDGYTDLARQTMLVATRLHQGIDDIDGLRVLGTPHCTVITYASDEPAIDIYAVADQMAKRDWSTDRQQSPPSIHCTINAHNGPVLDEYLADLRHSVEHVRAHPELATEGEAAMYGMMAKVPVRGLVKHSVGRIMEGMYSPEGEIPDLAELNDDDDPIMRLVNTYGDTAMVWLDRFNATRDRLAKALWRRS